MYDDYEIAINKDINVCFLSGTIISKPDFNFFYNSRKLISKAEFCLKTELGFNASNTFKLKFPFGDGSFWGIALLGTVIF